LEEEIVEHVRKEIGKHKRWTFKDDCFSFPKQERIVYLRSLSPLLYVHCDSIHMASYLLFGDYSPIYLKREDVLELWKEINCRFLYSWTKIAFQKALIQKCFHPILLSSHSFDIGLCYYGDSHFQVSDRMSSSQIFESTLRYRPGVINLKH
jgi:hypothetical protein